MDLSFLLKVSIAVILCTLVISCSSTRKWKKQFDGPIVFGSYGGFAGSFDEYQVHASGDVYHKSRIKSEPQMIMTISDDLKNQIFKTIIEEKFYEESIDEPGNMTYFLKFWHKGEECDLKWGSGQVDPTQKLLEYHNFLSKHINAKSPTM